MNIVYLCSVKTDKHRVMHFKHRILYKLIFIGIALSLVCHVVPSKAAIKGAEHSVLIISSYNPESVTTSQTIADFIDEFKRISGINYFALENLNCGSFSEAPQWGAKVARMIANYQGEQKPSLIVLMGQEAWAAYLSLMPEQRGDVPVLASQVSRNYIPLPSDTTAALLRAYKPDSYDFFDESPRSNVRGGLMRDFDVESNLKLIRHFYPHTRHIALVTDNTYGGVSLQAYVRKQMGNHPDMDLIEMDGRVNSIYTMCDSLSQLPDSTVILLGTWRIDKNEGYFMRDATYSMREAVPEIPVFTLTSTGLNYWAIGGVVPLYREDTKELARQAYDIICHPEDKHNRISVLPTETVLDRYELEKRSLNPSGIEGPMRYLHDKQTFYEQYTTQIWVGIVAVVFLILILVVFMYQYFRMRRLRDILSVSEKELRSSEAELRVAMEKAEESNRLKSAFLANMSHEIRTPLNAIVGFSDVLTSGAVSQDEQRLCFDAIKNNSDLLLHLITDILDVARLEADHINFTYHDEDAVMLCQQALNNAEVCNKGNDNRFEFSSELSSLHMQIDANRLLQVFKKLLTNADKFTEKGTITIGFRRDEASQTAFFSVTDTGCGIPKEMQEKVFERFEKIDEFKPGNGLGLSICQLTVEKWGGKIWVDPDYTGGSRFIFTHPIRN